MHNDWLSIESIIVILLNSNLFWTLLLRRYPSSPGGLLTGVSPVDARSVLMYGIRWPADHTGQIKPKKKNLEYLINSYPNCLCPG